MYVLSAVALLAAIPPEPVVQAPVVSVTVKHADGIAATEPIVVWLVKSANGDVPTTRMADNIVQCDFPLGPEVNGRFFPVVAPGLIRVHSTADEVRGVRFSGVRNSRYGSALLLKPESDGILRIEKPELFPVRISFTEDPETFQYLLPLSHSFATTIHEDGRGQLRLPGNGVWLIKAFSDRHGLLDPEQTTLHSSSAVFVGRKMIRVEVDSAEQELGIVLK
jgi:hypothetical protein